jgi:uncharacterized protein (DUF433 family)
MRAELTINEAAHLAGVSPRLIEKSVEAGILRAEKVHDALTRRATRRVPLVAVPYLSAITDEWLRDLPLARKRRFWSILSRHGLARGARLAELRLNEKITLDMEKLAGSHTRGALAYRDARDEHLASDPDILGGTPVIRGTRLTVHAILGRLEGGDTLADLREDYPGIPAEAFSAAETYARTHPLRGRPAGRPWAADAGHRA